VNDFCWIAGCAFNAAQALDLGIVAGGPEDDRPSIEFSPSCLEVAAFFRPPQPHRPDAQAADKAEQNAWPKESLPHAGQLLGSPEH